MNQRLKAKKNGLKKYKSAIACKNCLELSWRSVATNQCFNCRDLDRGKAKAVVYRFRLKQAKKLRQWKELIDRHWNKYVRYKEQELSGLKSLRSRLCYYTRRTCQGKPIVYWNEEWIGCSQQEYAEHLEDKFQPGMNWENWGRDGWHVDHVRPIASFENKSDLSCWHYSNLQPLWAEDNIRKSNRLSD